MKKQVFNPYLPSYEYVPDGEPRVFDGRLYIYGSHDRFDSDFYCLNDYVAYSAPIDDLSDWRYEGVIYKKTQDPRNPNGEHSMFAPDVVQGKDGRYYLYYGLDFISSVSVAVADTPIGPFEFLDYVRHADGEVYGEDVQRDPFQFDPGVLVDDNGRVYLYTGFAPNEEVVKAVEGITGVKLGKLGNHVVELSQDMTTAITEPKQLIPNNWDSQGTGFEGHAFYEASSIRKFNGRYYFIYSSYLSHELAFAVSDSPTENFVYGGSLHSNADIGVNGNTEAQNYWGNNHGSIVQVNDSFYVFGHRQTNYSEFSRQGIAEPIIMKEDGLFRQAELTSCGLNQGPLMGSGKYPASIACHLTGPDGAIKSIDVNTEALKARHPSITQDRPDNSDSGEQYIQNFVSGSQAGYKYFDFKDLQKVGVEYLGQAKGTIFVSLTKDGPSFAEIEIQPEEDWTVHDVKISETIKGIHALYLRFEGQGSLDLKSICFN